MSEWPTAFDGLCGSSVIERSWLTDSDALDLLPGGLVAAEKISGALP